MHEFVARMQRKCKCMYAMHESSHTDTNYIAKIRFTTKNSNMKVQESEST